MSKKKPAGKHIPTGLKRNTIYFLFDYFFIESSTAACAAAKRAIGTRKGEQLA